MEEKKSGQKREGSLRLPGASVTEQYNPSSNRKRDGFFFSLFPLFCLNSSRRKLGPHWTSPFDPPRNGTIDGKIQNEKKENPGAKVKEPKNKKRDVQFQSIMLCGISVTFPVSTRK